MQQSEIVMDYKYRIEAKMMMNSIKIMVCYHLAIKGKYHDHFIVDFLVHEVHVINNADLSFFKVQIDILDGIYEIESVQSSSPADLNDIFPYHQPSLPPSDQRSLLISSSADKEYLKPSSSTILTVFFLSNYRETT